MWYDFCMNDSLALEQIKTLQWQPGDILVIESPRVLSRKSFEKIKAALEWALPDGAQVLILEDGLTIKVVRP